MKFVPNAVARKVARQALLTQKNSPKVLFALGIAGTTASTVLACRATLKLETVLNECQRDVHLAKTIEHDEYSEDDRKKDMAIIYAQTAVKLGKLYAPSIVVGAFAVGALTKSHHMLSERNVAITAAYAALDKGFGQYRARVIEKFGEDQDREFRYESEEVDVYDEKLGKDVSFFRVAPGAESVYARFFDQYSPSWSKEPEYNLLFIKCQQNYANDLLRSRGHVFLNEVYDMLGIERSKAGAVVGWVIGPNGDNYIDFGVFDDTENARDFVNGREGSILLDFNVDGVIFDKIGDEQESVSWQTYP